MNAAFIQTNAAANVTRPMTGAEAETMIFRTNLGLRQASRQSWEDGSAGRRVALRLMQEFGAAAAALEELGWSADDIQDALRPSREVFATASFMRRCQEWPRGYAGDFETIEYLAGATNYSEPGTLGWHFEDIILQSPVAQQHRNKLNHQTKEIARTILSRRDARILSIACGGCLDWTPVLPHLACFEGEIVLNDCEPAALELAESRFQPATNRYRLAPGNVLRVAKRLASGPRFDLAVAGGLFDYLNDKAIIFLLRTIVGELLAPGGVLLFTNIADGNPWRPLMEHGSNWQLIERSEEQMVRLCREAGIPSSQVSVTRESTGLTLLTRVVLPHAC
jgi:SAM-dependent methyltransferase